MGLQRVRHDCPRLLPLEKTLENPLDRKENQSVHPKGNQSWILIGRTDAEAETPILWPPDAKNWLIWKDPDAGNDWRWKENGTTEDEMVGWHHWLNGHEFESAPGAGDGQGGLACCSPQGRKELDTTEQLNWTELRSYWGRECPNAIWLVSLKKTHRLPSGLVIKTLCSQCREGSRFDPWSGN